MKKLGMGRVILAVAVVVGVVALALMAARNRRISETDREMGRAEGEV